MLKECEWKMKCCNIVESACIKIQTRELECHNFEEWTQLKVSGRRKEMKTKRHFATHVMKGVVF